MENHKILINKEGKIEDNFLLKTYVNKSINQ